MTSQTRLGDDDLPVPAFDPGQIFIGREQQLDLFEIYLNRWRKLLFVAEPNDTLVTTAPSPNNKIQGFVVLLYGRGGFGKSTLLRRYHDIVLKENQDPRLGKITVSNIIDWEFAIEGKRGLFNPPKGQEIDASEYLKILCGRLAIALDKKLQEFKKYQLALKEVERASKEANGILDNMQKDEHYASLRALAGPGVITLLRWIAPRIGQALDSAKVTEKVEEVVGKGAGIGVEQLVQLHVKLKDKLGAKLGDYLEPELRLGLALGEDLCEFAKNFPLLIFFDTYEEIDEGDRLLRITMGAAGLRVGWVLAGRDNLWAGSEQRERSITLEYGYRDIVPPDRGLPIDFNVGGVGAFTISDIIKYFVQMRKEVRYKPPLLVVTEKEAERILDVTQGVPLAVKIAAGLYMETANLEIVTEKAESKRKIVDQMVRRYLVHVHDDWNERAQLYGLALLRRADQPTIITAALGLAPEEAKTNYMNELSRLHRRYSFIFTEKEHPLLHQEVRHFLRLWLQEHHSSPEIMAINEQLKEAHETELKKLEERRQYSSLKVRMEDDEWIAAYLDLTEQHFWLDPVEAIEYALPFMLAAAIYRRKANQDVVEIGKFFEREIPQPYHRHWVWATHSLVYSTSHNPSREELTGLEELAKLINQRTIKLSLPLILKDFQRELEAALWWRLGEAYSTKNVQKSLEWFEKALSQIEQEVELREETALTACDVGTKLYQEGKFVECISIFDRAIELDPTIPYIYNDRGSAYATLKKYQEAIANYEHAIKLDPTHNHFYINRGGVYAELKKYPEAIADLDYAIKLDSTDARAYHERGDVYSNLQDYQRAIADYSHAIKLKSTDAAFYYNRGRAYAALKEYEQAIADYSHAIKLKSTDAAFYYNRGRAYAALKEYEQAIADYNHTLKLDSSFEHRAQKEKGLALYSLRRHQEAVNIFQKALKAVPACPECLISLARAYSALHSNLNSQTEAMKSRVGYEAVLEYFDHSIKLYPVDVNAIANRGAIYGLMGYYEKALADFDCANSLDRTMIDNVREFRGLVLSYLGRYDEAVETYEHLLKEETDDHLLLYNTAVAVTRWKGQIYSQAYIDKARAALLDMMNTEEYDSAMYGLAGLEALTGNSDRALDYLQGAISSFEARGYPWTVWAHHDAAWLDLRNDPRFQALISEAL